MRLNRPCFIIGYVIILLLSSTIAEAQLGFDLTIKKPEPYQDRVLKSEKSSEKKFKIPRRFVQNTTTHYNYFFNANTKLNEILDRAKQMHKDDYATLLSFYNYSLENTAQDSDELDSVIHKTKSGIVLHDLRNDWIDDLYLLWGASYYFQQEFDSAYQMFQFINYAFAEKEKDGYYRYIGSRMDGNEATSISTKEDDGFMKRMLSEPPSRNEAFLWQIRTLTNSGAYPEAGSLVATLKNDPIFPERLHDDLEEVQAYLFYKQGVWDSAAIHLVNALSTTKSKQERARWEYLAGQLFEKTGKLEEAKNYYSRAISHTTDPVMDIYARLNMIRINKEGGDNYIDNNIAELLKMAKRDKYTEYRDVIYSMAAQMELERGNLEAAQALLLKASKYKTDNTATSNRAYLQLADLAFTRKDYLQAAAFYDSIMVQNLPTEDADKITQRKNILAGLVNNLAVIERQDSLQRIAAMPEEEREEFIKKLVKQLRKSQGLGDEDVTSGGRVPTTSADPFDAQSTKGEWYFYNKNLKTNGAAAFKQTWGNRPNADNWRRFSAVNAQMRNTLPLNAQKDLATGVVDDNTELTYESLLNRLPITAEAYKKSNDSIKLSLYNLGHIYVNELEDYEAAIEALENFRRRFPNSDSTAKVLFLLYYSYTKTGNTARANEIKNELAKAYPASKETSIVNAGKNANALTGSAEVTKVYEDIYDMFVEGRFDEAMLAKQRADSMYMTNKWSPQLLYIEAVYHIRQREDSLAKNKLNLLAQQHGGTPMGEKAENLIQVLNRRHEIEAELHALQIERPIEDTLYVEPMPVAPQVVAPAVVTNQPKDSVVTKPGPIVNKPVSDSIFNRPTTVKTNSVYTLDVNVKHYVVILLNKVDVVYGNEARNAFTRYNREKYYGQPLESSSMTLNDDLKLVLVGKFDNAQGAIDYVQKAKPIAATQIVPWLKADKYRFSIISEANLEVVTNAKDFNAYEKFLDQNLPVKF